MKWSTVLAGVCVLLSAVPPSRAEEIPAEYRRVIDKGLEWVAKEQHRDGHWEANGGAYPTTMTGLGGMVLLMQGSTIRDGKYAENIRRATDWLMGCAQRSGLISPLANNGRGYIHDHGYALLFLACVYGEEEDGDRRRRLEGILTRAVDFTGKAQTKRGGWGYTSAAEGGDFDEGSTTITQLQAVRACRNAGIAVPRAIIERAQKYLKDATTARGGILYSLAQGGSEGGPALVAAAIAGGFSSGEYNSPEVKKWLTYARTAIPIAQAGRFGHDEYTHYYYAQALYVLGDEGYAKLFPDSHDSDRLGWSKYKKVVFPYLVKSQNADGSWNSGNIGAIYTTTCNLTILQLDNGTLPIYQR